MESTIYFPRSIFPGRRELSSVYMGSLGSNEKRLVTKAGANASYVAPYLLFYRDQTLFGQPFDTNKFEPTGEAIPILTDIQYWPRISEAVFAATSYAACWWRKKPGDSGASQLLWFNRQRPTNWNRC